MEADHEKELRDQRRRHTDDLDQLRDAQRSQDADYQNMQIRAAMERQLSQEIQEKVEVIYLDNGNGAESSFSPA